VAIGKAPSPSVVAQFAKQTKSLPCRRYKGKIFGTSLSRLVDKERRCATTAILCNKLSQQVAQSKDVDSLVGVMLPTELDNLGQPGFGRTPFYEALVNMASSTASKHGLDPGNIIGFKERKH
jgi:hypothetical protein